MFGVILYTVVVMKIVLFQNNYTFVGHQATSYTIIGFRKKFCSSYFFIKHSSPRIYSFFLKSLKRIQYWQYWFQQQCQHFIKNLETFLRSNCSFAIFLQYM